MRDLVRVSICFLAGCCFTFLVRPLGSPRRVLPKLNGVVARSLLSSVLAAVSSPCFWAAPTSAQVQGETAGHTPLDVHSMKPKRVIEARQLAKLVREGVHITNATIRGPLDMSYSVVNQQVSLINCDFEERADFSYSTFKRHVVVRGSTFRKGATFEGTIFELNAALDSINFLTGDARFNDIHVHGLFDMRDAEFSNGVEAFFARARFDKAADFSRGVFAKATFSDVEVGSDLFFRKARFHKMTILTTAKIAGALFLEGAEFEEFAGLAGIQITYNAKMKGAIFKGIANFTDAQINSFLDLSGAKFESRAAPAHFNSTRIAGSGSFDNAYFASGAQFNSAHFGSDASFDWAVFEGPVSFERAHFDQTAHLDNTTFMNDVIFHETSFGALDLSPSGRVLGRDQLQARIDLRGCTYGRIQAKWQSLLRMPNGNSRLIGYDRQPYFQLEKFYQRVGDDRTANSVSLEWHRVRRQELFQSSKIRWLIDCVPWTTTNYDVAPGRLLEISLIFLFFGMLIFSRPGAVISNGSEGKERSGNREGTTVQLSHWDAVALSVHQFLPLDVPFGSQWTPGNTAVELKFRHHNLSLTLLRMRPATCATLLKIGGYILVPLEILVLNGLIKGGQLALPWE